MLESGQAAQKVLNEGTTLYAAGRLVDSGLLRELNLLTTKPFLYVFNADEAVLTDNAKLTELRELVAPADAVTPGMLSFIDWIESGPLMLASGWTTPGGSDTVPDTTVFAEVAMLV